MRIVIFLMALAVISCNTQKRCARFVAKHPECFQDTTITRTDTITRELQKWDTLISASTDTILVPTPCGDIQITKDQNGNTRISQTPKIKEVRIETNRETKLPCPCDCQEQARKITQLKKQLKEKGNRGWAAPWWVPFVAFGIGIVARSLIK